MSIALSREKAYIKITVSSDTHWAVHQCFKTSYCCSVNFTLTGKKEENFIGVQLNKWTRTYTRKFTNNELMVQKAAIFVLRMPSPALAILHKVNNQSKETNNDL